MSSRAIVTDLEITLEPDEARRYLGYPPGGTTCARGARRLGELWPETLPLLAPRGAYALVPRASAEGAGMPDLADVVAVAVVTVGPALEDECARRSAAGALLDALVLDAVGSAAAEAAADALNLVLCAVAAARGLEAAPRASPGYGEWETSCQPRLLALLPIEALGIRLTAGAMMVPRKSVSFAVRMERPGVLGPHGTSTRCERCGLPRCRHRIAPVASGATAYGRPGGGAP